VSGGHEPESNNSNINHSRRQQTAKRVNLKEQNVGLSAEPVSRQAAAAHDASDSSAQFPHIMPKTAPDRTAIDKVLAWTGKFWVCNIAWLPEVSSGVP
jgi:hypothetical protein